MKAYMAYFNLTCALYLVEKVNPKHKEDKAYRVRWDHFYRFDNPANMARCVWAESEEDAIMVFTRSEFNEKHNGYAVKFTGVKEITMA